MGPEDERRVDIGHQASVVVLSAVLVDDTLDHQLLILLGGRVRSELQSLRFGTHQKKCWLDSKTDSCSSLEQWVGRSGTSSRSDVS
jgi:hypothetical protein